MKKLLILTLCLLSMACQSYGGAGMEMGWSADASDDPVMKPAAPAEFGFSKAVDAPQAGGEQVDAVTGGVQIVRQVVLDAALRLVVVSADDAREAVLAAARAVGGYLQQSDAHSIVVRVPAASFDGVIGRIERLGEVVERNVRAEDVTEELFDVDLRIDNARRTRERLLAHLEKSESIEDTIKLEAEIMRLSGEIERLEGRKRLLDSKVAMSTIRVEFNTPKVPESRDARGLDMPFEWITRLGDGLIAGAVQHTTREPRIFAAGPRFDAPKDFVKYHSTKTLVEALEPDGVRITVERHENHDKASIGFWQRLARRSLVEYRAIAITEEIAVDTNRALLVGSREVGQRSDGYMLLLVRTDDRVVTFEAWGPKARFYELRTELEASARTLRP